MMKRKKKLPQLYEVTLNLTANQQKVVEKYNLKVQRGDYRLIDNPCLCGNSNADKDEVIAEKDRFGIQVNNVLCNECGLIRSAQILDDEATVKFYTNEYRALYTKYEEASIYQYFSKQRERGEGFFNLLKRHDLDHLIEEVVELGCGAGGILKAFQDKGKKVEGFDYDAIYLAYGQRQGLQLFDLEMQQPNKQYDLVILSHVMEHFNHPKSQLVDAIEKVKPGKYLMIEVPGFYHSLKHANPYLGLQSAHVISYYYKNFLVDYFKSFGLKVIFGNERCTFILNKPSDWDHSTISTGNFYNDQTRKEASIIREKFIGSHKYAFNTLFSVLRKIKQRLV